MLKMLSNHHVLSGTPNAKCGIIYCHSSTSFTILCSLCELKTFDFEDFLLHVKNIHFDDDLLQASDAVSVECKPYLDMKMDLQQQSSHLIGHPETGVDIGSECENISRNNKYSSIINENDSTMCNKSEDSYKDDDENGITDCDEDVDSEGVESDDEYRPPFKIKRQNAKAEVRCKRCNKICKNAGLLKIHINKEHTNIQKATQALVKCPQCDQEFTNKNLLHAHKLKEHGGLQCTHCVRKFENEATLNKHEVTHTAEKNFVCDFEHCGKRFFTRRRLNSHKQIHTAPKNMVCDICAYSCRTTAMLQIHYRTHTGEKPFSCQICNKSFASTSMLSEHQASHTTDRTHVCDVCGATFTRQKALYHHKHLHLAVKKFVCKLCGKAYAQAAGLAGHKRKHKE